MLAVSTIHVVAEPDQSTNAGINGRNRQTVTDILSLILGVFVTAASPSDTAGGRNLSDL